MKKTAVVLLGILLTLSLNANAGFKSSGYKSSRSSAYSRPSVSSTTTKSGYQVNSSAGKNSSAVTTASRAPVSTMNGKKLTDNKGKIRTSENKPADTRPDYSNMQPQNAGKAFAGSSSTRPDSLLNGNHQPSAQIQNTIRQKESGGFGLTHLAILYLLMSDNSHSMSDSDRAWVERKIEEEKQNNDIAESPDKPDEFQYFPETDNGATDSASLAENAEKNTSLYLDIARILFIVFAFAYVLYKLVQAATGSITWHSALISSALTSMAGLMVFYLNGILNVLF